MPGSAGRPGRGVILRSAACPHLDSHDPPIVNDRDPGGSGLLRDRSSMGNRSVAGGLGAISARRLGRVCPFERL